MVGIFFTNHRESSEHSRKHSLARRLVSEGGMVTGVDVATKLYSRVFKALTYRWQEAVSFRQLANLGLPGAEAALEKSNTEAMEALFSPTEMGSLVRDRDEFMAWVGGPKGLAATITSNQIVAFRSAVDAASIVFLHSTLDAAVSDLCEIAALLAPGDWEHWMSDKRVSLGQVKNQGYDELLSAELRSAIENLKRDSLLKRVDRLFAICQPPPRLELINNFVFDDTRLEQIDTVRHDIIHGAGINAPVADVEGALEVLHRSGLFLFALLNWKYHIKLDVSSSFTG